MMWLVGAFVFGMLFILMAVESDDEEREDEIDRRIWINYLADQSRKQSRRASRGRYGRSGVQRAHCK